METVVHSWNLVPLLPWELGVSHHVSFPVFVLHEKWAIGGCSVMNVNHPFETHFPVVPTDQMCGSWTARRELCWRGAPQTVRWEKPFPGPPVSLSVCSTCAFLCVFTQLQFSLTPVPPLAGGDTVISLLSSLLEHITFGFGTEVSISSPMTSIALGARCETLCILPMKTWAELNAYLMYSRRMPP